MKSRTSILYIITTLAAPSFSEPAPVLSDATIRVYCFYIPQAKKDAPNKEKYKAVKYEKLMKDSQPVHLPARYNASDKTYILPKKTHEEAVRDCELYVLGMGEFLGMQAGDAAYFEKLTRFYPILKEGLVAIKGMTDAELLADLQLPEDFYLEKGDAKEILQAISSSAQEVKEISEKLKGTELQRLTESGLEQSGDPTAADYRVTAALTVAAFLAANWFLPAVIPAGAEFLYSLVYQALWGVPSQFNPTYWMLYLPGKRNAGLWAAANSKELITASVTAVTAAAQEYLSQPKTLKKGVKKEKVAADLKDLNKSIKAK